MDDDVYQMRQDPAITVGYRLETGELALIWTTTPWTLPSNLGVAVHPDVDYVVVQGDRTAAATVTSSRRRGSRPTPASSGTDAAERIVARSQGIRAGRAPLHAAVHLLRWGMPARTRSRRRTSSRPRTAPGWST
jgi:hypothetical protein